MIVTVNAVKFAALLMETKGLPAALDAVIELLKASGHPRKDINSAASDILKKASEMMNAAIQKENT